MQFTHRQSLPISYYINNGNLAEKAMLLIASPIEAEHKLSSIKKLALGEDQEYMGEPTFARALLELINRIDTNLLDKLNLIADLAKITIVLRDLKIRVFD